MGFIRIFYLINYTKTFSVESDNELLQNMSIESSDKFLKL